jgi:hypothetical protein
VLYERLRKALEVSYLPLFFLYFGNFPRYLSHLSDQLIVNLDDRRFQDLAQEVGDDILYLIMETLDYPENITSWKSRYRHGASFIHFEQDLEQVFRTNTKLVFLFLSLREAVKGWAVAAKKLPGSNQHGTSTDEPGQKNIHHHIFVFEDHQNLTSQESSLKIQTSGTIFRSGSLASRQSSEITVRNTTLEQNLLPTYLMMCQQAFADLMKQPHFWILRVRLEELIIRHIHTLPHPIHSPINLVRSLAGDKDTTNDFLHLLSDHFPTYAVQRLMYSGYMKG